MKPCILIFMLIAGCLPLSAQNQDAPTLLGRWVGHLTQNEGGYLSNYSFEIYFWEANEAIRARSYVAANNIEGVMNVVGRKVGTLLFLKEEGLISSRKPEDLYWCFKTMQLRLTKKEDVWYLEGAWQGASDQGECIPGWIVLKKGSVRA